MIPNGGADGLPMPLPHGAWEPTGMIDAEFRNRKFGKKRHPGFSHSHLGEFDLHGPGGKRHENAINTRGVDCGIMQLNITDMTEFKTR